MIQLAFESAFDPFHTAFRLLRPLHMNVAEPIMIERMKILDVYMAEPRRCTEIRVPQAMKRSARQAAHCQHPTYGRRPSTNALFDRMKAIQDAAIETLVMQGLLDSDAFSKQFAKRSEFALASPIIERIERANTEQAPLMKFLYQDLNAFSLDGQNGLKDRTKLGEYRYDVV